MGDKAKNGIKLFTEDLCEEIGLDEGYIHSSYTPPGKNECYDAVVEFAYLRDNELYGEVTVEKTIKRTEGKGYFSKLFVTLFPEKTEWWIDTKTDKSGRVNKDGFSRIEPGFADVKKTLEGIAAKEKVSLSEDVLYYLFDGMDPTVKNIYEKVRALN